MKGIESLLLLRSAAWSTAHQYSTQYSGSRPNWATRIKLVI